MAAPAPKLSVGQRIRKAILAIAQYRRSVMNRVRQIRDLWKAAGHDDQDAEPAVGGLAPGAGGPAPQLYNGAPGPGGGQRQGVLRTGWRWARAAGRGALAAGRGIWRTAKVLAYVASDRLSKRALERLDADSASVKSGKAGRQAGRESYASRGQERPDADASYQPYKPGRDRYADTPYDRDSRRARQSDELSRAAAAALEPVGSGAMRPSRSGASGARSYTPPPVPTRSRSAGGPR